MESISHLCMEKLIHMKDTSYHMRKLHLIEENVDEMRCLVENCSKNLLSNIIGNCSNFIFVQ